MNLDDTQLMQRVQQGEFHCFDHLVERYRPALLRVAAGMAGDGALAEDLVQETFLAVFAARHTYKAAFPFRTWLWTILLNLCRRHRAKQARRSRQAVGSGFETSAGQGVRDLLTPETGLAAVLKREQSARLQTLLNELPDKQADAIRLRFFAELPYDEIARLMGVSLGGAKLRVRSGISKLSRRLREDGETRNEL